MHTASHATAVWPMLVSDHGETLSHSQQMATMAQRYHEQLSQHLQHPGEATLLAAYEMGKDMIRNGLTPEEAMAFQIQALNQLQPPVLLEESNRFLMEVMTAFGNAFRAIHARVDDDDTLRHNYSKLKHALGDTLEAINTIRETKDAQTTSHQHRVSQLAVAIAERLGLDDDRIEGLRVAASLHDVGMVQVPDAALKKPGRLAPSEIDLVRAHPEAGYDMLKDIESPWPIAEIARQHHERIDGKGYPYGLKGDDILLESRVISVADTVEAMISQRPYRAALDISSALDELMRGRGTRFDAAAVDICTSLFKQENFTFH
ncbi:MAG: HD domain-containing protein [Mariprofundales bacterium]